MSLPELERFSIVRLLGEGGFGSVYEAVDRKHGSTVALKLLHRVQPSWLYRFKREFRALADLRHKNLVSLYELGSEGDRFFLTMELIDGAPFVRWVGGGDAADSQLTTRDERLRAALAELVLGVHALHAAGKLHRDIKPSNVLVTRKGRVVLLDFGLVTDLGRGDDSLGMVGTPSYMSPEQCREEPLGPPSDWYSVGVMLYRSLTGQLPFEGGSLVQIEEKLRFDAARPSSVARDVPADLDDLCVELLRREPAERPSGDAILERTRRDAGRSPPSIPPPAARGAQFIGRAAELERLFEAYDSSRAGKATVAMIHGRSGMGKTALCDRFFSELRRRDADAIILRGRCYEHESVPFKALDSLVDELARFLHAEPAAIVDAVKPRGIAPLTRLFPVLRRVEAFVDSSGPDEPTTDDHELRQRAARALRELLGRLADRRPTVLAIDDLHWGDIDSAALLGQVLWPPDAPPLLLIGTYRRDDVDTNEFLQALTMLKQRGTDLAILDVALEPLSAEESERMLRALARGTLDDQRVDRIVREAAGSPFFIVELVEDASSSDDLRPRRPFRVAEGSATREPVNSSRTLGSDPTPAMLDAREGTLDRMVQRRVERLPPPARALLEVVAVAGRPVVTAIARMAAGGSDDETVAALRADRLIRGHAGEGELECTHDQIRTSVLGTLDDDAQRAIHRRLVDAFVESGTRDDELLARHLAAAGEAARAAVHARAAADRASALLAFDHAARLYDLAREQRQHAGLASDADLLVLLGEALSKAGRGGDAARALVAAAELVTDEHAADLRRRAAAHFLRSGYINRGLDLARTSLADLGIRVPRQRFVIVLLLLWLRVRIRIALALPRRTRPGADPDALRRLDAVRRMGAVMILFDLFIGAMLASEFVWRALRLGDPESVVLALGTEAMMSGAMPGGERRSLTLITEARALAPKSGAADLDVHLPVLEAGIHFGLARPRECFEACERAERAAAGRDLEHGFDRASVRLYRAISAFFLGRWDDLPERYARHVDEYKRLGNVYGHSALTTRIGWIVAAMRDEPASALAEIEDLRRRWTQGELGGGNHPVLFAKAWLAIYAGNGREALDLWRRFSQRVRAARLHRVPAIVLDGALLGANAALCAAREVSVIEAGARAPNDVRALGAHVREAERAALALEEVAVGRPLATLVRAECAALSEDRAAALALFGEAEGGARERGLEGYAMAAAWCRATLADDQPSARRSAAFFEKRCANPVAFARLLSPALELSS